MSAPTGNSNATKWTETRTLMTLERIEKYALMDHVPTLSRALVKVRIYKGIWTYWKHRWSKHEEIMDRICYIEQIFMMKIEEGGLSKRWHAGMCLFMLQINYGQRDLTKRYYRQHMTDELPSHLVKSYNDAINAEEKVKKEIQEKRLQEEKEKAAKERAAKKEAKLQRQHDTGGAAAQNEVERTSSKEISMYPDSQIPEVPVVNINRVPDDTISNGNVATGSDMVYEQT